MIVRKTSETAAGQIYLPQINMFLLSGLCCWCSSSRHSDNSAPPMAWR